MSDLPERINVMKVISYDVERLVSTIKEELYEWGEEDKEITVESVLDYIERTVQEDYGLNPEGCYYTDENGEQL